MALKGRDRIGQDWIGSIGSEWFGVERRAVDWRGRNMKLKGAKGPKEDVIQAQCVRWFRLQYPKSLIFSIPNAAKRTKYLRFIMLSTGMVSGMPDLVIPEPHGAYHGAYIEMKSENGKLTESQEKILEYLKSRSYFTAVCYSFDEFRETVSGYMNLTPLFIWQDKDDSKVDVTN